MSKGQALNLWIAILAFAAAVGEVQGEGNSGEFHNALYAAEAKKDLTSATQNLVTLFHKATGWLPEFKDAEYEEWTIDSWELVKK